LDERVFLAGIEDVAAATVGGRVFPLADDKEPFLAAGLAT